MNILKYFKNQFKTNSSINTVEKNNVLYAAYYKDIGNGYSSVECAISTLFNNQKYSFSIDTKIPNKLIENDGPVILPISDKGKDFVIFSFPEERKQSNTEFSIISYATYQVNLEPSSIDAIPHGKKMSLSNNAKLSHSSNKYHSYSKPKAIELPNGDIIIAAIDSNSEGQYVTAWLLEKRQNLEFNVNEGSNKVTNRLLFKVDENVESSFQLLPAKQNSNVGKIIYSDSTSLFSLDVAESMINDIRERKYVNNDEDEKCLFKVGNVKCDTYDNNIPTPFLTGEDISNLSAVNTKNGAVVAFLENEQQLYLAKLTGKKGKKQIVHNYKEKIKSLQLSSTGEDDIIVSAVGEKNITQSTISSDNLKVVTTRDFSTDGVKTLDDLIDIVYNNLPKLTTSFPYSDAPKTSSGTVSITTPLATEEITTRGSTTTVEKDTTNAAIMGTTTQRTTIKPKTTKHTTVTTTASTKQPTSTERATTTAKTTAETSTAQHTTAGQSTIVTTISTTQPPKITTPEEKTTRGSTTTVEKDTTNAATTDVTTASTTQPTTTERATTTAKTAAETSTAQHTTTDQSTIKTTIPTVRPTTSSKITTSTKKIPVKPTTKSTAKSTARLTNRYTTSTERGSTTIISTSSPKSTTTETQRINSTLGLAPTIVSAIMTTLRLVTQNVTNMITTDNNSMITDSSPNLNQTDVSSNYEEKSLSIAEVSATVLVPIAVIGIIGVICFYKFCNKNRMRNTPSNLTNRDGFCQRLRSCFNGQEQTIHALQLEPLDGDNANRVDSNEDEIVVYQKGISSSSDNLLPDQDQNSNDGVSNSASTVEKGKTSVNSELGSTEVSNGAGQNCNAKDRESAV